MGRIRTPSLPSQGKVHNRTVVHYGLLRFSFKFLDLHSNLKFSIDQCEDGYLEKLLCRLRDLSAIKVSEFRENKSTAIRAHRITWDDTTEPGGFSCLNSQLRDEDAWQFEITQRQHGRVHGILLDEVFYVIWIDPKHELFNK